MNNDNNLKTFLKVEPATFFISAGFTLIFVIWGLSNPDAFAEAMSAAFAWTTGTFDWFYLLGVLILILATAALLFTPLGSIKLGKPEDKPEFSTFSWLAMIFSAAIAAGIVFWGPAEPAMHWMWPYPFFGQEATTPENIVPAMTVSFFHWGIHPWAIYLCLAVPLAYCCYRKDLPFRMSTALYPLLGEGINGPVGKLLDIIAVFATVGGIATTTGLVSLQLGAGLDYTFGMEVTDAGIFGIIAVLTALFTLSVVSGVHKGIKMLSQFNIVLFVILAIFIFIAGPTLFIVHVFTDSLGKYINYLPHMSTWLNLPGEGAFVHGWTVFYWAWWLAWAPFVSMFLARVCKGRTIRETVGAVVIIPTLVNFAWYAAAGGSGIYYDITQAVAEYGEDVAIFETAMHLPLTGLVSGLFVILIASFFLTSADSASLAASMFVSGAEEPTRYLRAFWGIALGLVAAVLTVFGGVEGLQTASIIVGLPMVLILLFVVAGMFKILFKEHFPRGFTPQDK